MPTPTQTKFLQIATDKNILKFGSFTLKSGRESPYFFNAGLFNTGSLLSALCDAYADTIVSSKLDFDVLFGPAYKGIPLSAVTAVKLAESKVDVGYAFNRKEAKAHGEGGSLVGADLKGKRVLVIDDVMTAGTAIREAIKIIHDAGGTLAGVVVALDRQERGTDSTMSTVKVVEKDYGIKVHAIVTFADIIEYSKGALSEADTSSMEEYRKQYGVSLVNIDMVDKTGEIGNTPPILSEDVNVPTRIAGSDPPQIKQEAPSSAARPVSALNVPPGRVGSVTTGQPVKASVAAPLLPDAASRSNVASPLQTASNTSAPSAVRKPVGAAAATPELPVRSAATVYSASPVNARPNAAIAQTAQGRVGPMAQQLPTTTPGSALSRAGPGLKPAGVAPAQTIPRLSSLPPSSQSAPIRTTSVPPTQGVKSTSLANGAVPVRSAMSVPPVNGVSRPIPPAHAPNKPGVVMSSVPNQYGQVNRPIPASQAVGQTRPINQMPRPAGLSANVARPVVSAVRPPVVYAGTSTVSQRTLELQARAAVAGSQMGASMTQQAQQRLQQQQQQQKNLLQSQQTNATAPRPVATPSNPGPTNSLPPVSGDISPMIDRDNKDEAENERTRLENRERKKRWREANEDRNKDNDLRCRVNKRAHKLFGKDASKMKDLWIEDEFTKRKSKRQEKEGKGPDGHLLVEGTELVTLNPFEMSSVIMATLTEYANGPVAAATAPKDDPDLSIMLRKLRDEPNAVRSLLLGDYVKPAVPIAAKVEPEDAEMPDDDEDDEDGSTGPADAQTETPQATEYIRYPSYQDTTSGLDPAMALTLSSDLFRLAVRHSMRFAPRAEVKSAAVPRTPQEIAQGAKVNPPIVRPVQTQQAIPRIPSAAPSAVPVTTTPTAV